MTATDIQREYRITPDCKRLIFEDGTELSVVDCAPIANSEYYHQHPQDQRDGRLHGLFAGV